MKTDFRVSKVFSDGTESECLIVPVTSLPEGVQMDRRVLFRAGLTLCAAAAALTSCSTPPPPQAIDARTQAKPDNSTPTTPPIDAPVHTAHTTPAPKPLPHKVHRRPRPDSDDSNQPLATPYYPYIPPSYGGYQGGAVTGGGTIERPCTPDPVPAGYICTCNCVAR